MSLPLDRAAWRRIEAVLDLVLELPPAERAGRVAALSAGDPGLMVEVEAFLAADAEADRFLAEPASERATELLVAVLVDDEDERPPAETLGPYELVRRLGRGGMGVVWEARDVRLGRRVAIKLLPEAVRDAPAAERLLREARAASALDHPNICTVHDVGTAPDGRLYLVLALYAGETLADLLARGPLPLDTALDLAIQVGRGLVAAHAAGIVHRDVKPSNVIVTGEGVAKILDFGISKTAGDGTLTGTGALLGTPGYMAPEQVTGGPVDGRADLWSLAVMLYEMLGGQRPFRGDSTEAVLYAIVHREPEPLGRLAPEVPPGLERALARALAKSPARRTASVADFVAELAAVRAASAASPARRPGMRRAAWATLALTAAGAAILLAPGARRAPERPPAGVSSRGSHELSQEATALLRHGYRPGHPERAITLWEEVLRADDRHAPAYAGLAEAHLWLYQRGPDATLLERARESAELAVDRDPQLARARRALGTVLAVQGRLEEALRHLDEAVRLDPSSAAAHRERSAVLSRLQRSAEAARDLTRAAEIDPADWLTHERLALDAYRRGDDAAAEAAFRRGLALAPDHSGLHDNLAAVHFRQGRLDEAAAELQRSLEIAPRDRTYTNLGTLQFSLGRHRAAVAAFEQAIELGANDYLNWANLGDGYRWTGEPDRASEAFLRALQLLAPELAKAPGNRTLRSRKALYLAKLGEGEAARREIGALEPLPEGEPDLAYRALVVHELTGGREAALAALRAALGAGYPLAEIRRDPELIELRKDSRYHRSVVPFEAAGGGSSGG